MGKQDIHCIVNDCHYWNQGNKCMAEKILVATDHFANNNPDCDMEMAEELTQDMAGSFSSTCCKTYVARGEHGQHDGVRKLSE
ncbi:MAG: DUF1540 domain-containing protein [Clostridia bacterium]|nr:DUF1540 domain-containing protein [Clostridia bacterium]